MTGFKALYRKEMCDYIGGKRFYIVFLLMLLVCAASISGAIQTLSSAESAGTDFLGIFTTSGSSLYSLATFIAFLGPLIGIMFGFDAITSERNQRTLTRLASQPIYRDAIINAKSISSAAVIALIMGIIVICVSGAGIITLGLYPTAEEVVRVLAFYVLSVVYICLWLAVAIIFSTVSKHSATVAIIVIAIWLFMTLFMTQIASAVSSSVYPLNAYSDYDTMAKNYNLTLALSRISPYYLFSEAATTILNPMVRAIDITSMAAYSGAIDSSLSVGQSLLLVWPHIVVMCALVIVGFAIAYVAFMKQELRA